MTTVIDTAIARLQDIALQVSGVKAAPDYPIDDAAGTLPLAIAHVTGATVTAEDATQTRFLITANVDFHVSRQSLRQAYTSLDTIIIDYGRRLAGDPTLNGTVDTIVFPVGVTVIPAQWDRVITQMASFQIQFKSLTTPSTSS